MKKLLLLFIVSTTSLQLFCQCEFIKNEKDEFTGDVIKITSEYKVNKKFTSRFFFGTSFVKINDRYSLHLSYTSGERPSMINAEQKLLIKLKDNTIIELKSFDSVITEADVSKYGTTYRIYPIYPITIEDFDKIVKIGISKIRMYTSKEYLEGDVFDKDNAEIINQINCILK
jgi:hypothetical protein